MIALSQAVVALFLRGFHVSSRKGTGKGRTIQIVCFTSSGFRVFSYLEAPLVLNTPTHHTHHPQATEVAKIYAAALVRDGVVSESEVAEAPTHYDVLRNIEASIVTGAPGLFCNLRVTINAV